MVQTKIDANPALSVSDAEALVKQDMGFGAQAAISLFEDYIEAKTDTNNSDAAEYATLHNIARVTAAVMADNYAELLDQIYECPEEARYLTANDDQGGGTYQVIEALRDRIDVVVKALHFPGRFIGDLLARIEFLVESVDHF